GSARRGGRRASPVPQGSAAQRAPPCQHPPFDEADDAVRDESEEPVYQEAEHDDVGLSVVLGLEHHVAEAAGGVDLLEYDEGEPGPGDAEPQPDEEAGQRAGDDDLPDELPAAEP